MSAILIMFSLVGVMFRNCTVAIVGTGEWSEEPPTCEHKNLYLCYTKEQCLTVYQH